MPDIIPAATLVLFRETPAGAPELLMPELLMPELLMVERARAMAFAGGAMVFPGGRVDPGDRRIAATLPGEPDETAARIAAIRETLEEVGVSIGLSPTPSPVLLGAMRARLHAGEAFDAVLADAGATIDPAALVPFARWLPDHALARIFDTRFFLAPMPADAVAEVDTTENVRLAWTTAQGMLDAADAGRATIIYPTRRNLERLARFASFSDAVADAAAHPIVTITPWVEPRNGRRHLCIPEGLGYPVTAEVLEEAVRG